MAKPKKLKVYRTAIGFHDAYVAAPSQKAALESWGTDRNLFAQGAAEVVEDLALTEAPLAQPGVVVKRLRGSAAEQIAALPPDPPRAAPSSRAPVPRSKPIPKRPATPKPPKPDRIALERVEQAIEEAERRHHAAEEALAEEEAALARRRRTQEAAHAKEANRLARAREQADMAYRAALAVWRG